VAKDVEEQGAHWQAQRRQKGREEETRGGEDDAGSGGRNPNKGDGGMGERLRQFPAVTGNDFVGDIE